jgi:hypothetical protein
MNQAGRDQRRLHTAARYISAAEAELAAYPNDRQLGELVTTMRNVIDRESVAVRREVQLYA